MNWDALAAIGEILGAVAVVVTLGYLSVQIRRSRLAARSQNIHAETEQIQRVMEMQASENLQEPLEKLSTGQELTYRDVTRLEALWLASLASLSDSYRHYKEGLEGGTAWEVKRRMVESTFLTPFARSWWRTAGRHVFESDFVAEVNAIIEKLPHHSDPVQRALSAQETNDRDG